MTCLNAGSVSVVPDKSPWRVLAQKTCSLDIGFRHMLCRLPGFALVPVWGSAAGAELVYILLIFICILKVCKLLTLCFNRLS